MKIIQLKQSYREDWVRVFNHIANLFYEDSKLQLAAEGAEMSVDMNYEVDQNNTVHTSATLVVGDLKYSSDYSIHYKTATTEKEQNIRLKRAMSHVFLNVLEQHTGMHQECRILS